MMKKNYLNSSGVTLIELGIVVALILVLVGIGLVEFKKVDKVARRNASLMASKAIADALRMYRADRKRYTTNIDDLKGYVNIEALKREFEKTSTNPANGVTIICEPTNCSGLTIYILGAPRGVTKPGTGMNQEGFYGTRYYVKPEDREPECYWNKSPGGHGWQECSKGL